MERDTTSDVLCRNAFHDTINPLDIANRFSLKSSVSSMPPSKAPVFPSSVHSVSNSGGINIPDAAVAESSQNRCKDIQNKKSSVENFDAREDDRSSVLYVNVLPITSEGHHSKDGNEIRSRKDNKIHDVKSPQLPTNREIHGCGPESEVVSAEEMAFLESALSTAAVMHARATAVRHAAIEAHTNGPAWAIRSRLASSLSSPATLRTGSSSCRGRSPFRRTSLSLTPASRALSATPQQASLNNRVMQNSGNIQADRWLGGFHRTSSCFLADNTLPLEASNNTNLHGMSLLKADESSRSAISISASSESHSSGVLNPSFEMMGKNGGHHVPAKESALPKGFGDWASPIYDDGASHRVANLRSMGALREVALTRNSLVQARVIGQAHDKFIVCVCGTNEQNHANSQMIGEDDSSLILLVDQHAADERIRLEAMEDLLLRWPERASCVSHAAQDSRNVTERSISAFKNEELTCLAHYDDSECKRFQMAACSDEIRPGQQKKDHVFGRCAASGITGVTVMKIGRHGRELWEAVKVPIFPPIALAGLELSLLNLLERIHPDLEAWGFKVR